MAYPEFSSHIPHARRVSVTIIDQERYDPSKNSHFGALVCKYEEGANDSVSRDVTVGVFPAILLVAPYL